MPIPRVLATGVWCCLAALGQQSITSATLSGRIEDELGGAIAHSIVRVVNADRNQKYETIADEQGRYRFPALPPGRYSLVASHERFAVTAQDIDLEIGAAMYFPIRLPLAGVVERVDVTSEAPAVEVLRTQLASGVAPKEIDALPLNGRNYLDLALLAPGVSRTNTGTNQRFAETSAVPGTGISVAGQRNLNNSFVVDGLSSNDDAADLAGIAYSHEVVREFQVITSGGIAEFGRASGGVLNVASKSGTNEWRGRIYGFLRNQRLDARNTFATRKDPLTQVQYGAALGGPWRAEKTFVYTNFEQTRQNAANFVTVSAANAAAVNSALDAAGYPGRRITTGEFATGYDSTNYFARLDHRLSEANQIMVRYSLYDIQAVNARGAGGLNTVTRGSGLDNRDQNAAVVQTAMLSPRSMNEARLQFTRSRLQAPINDPIGPAVNVSGIANLGTSTTSPTGRHLDVFQAVENLSLMRGSHALKVGADLLVNRVNIAYPGALQGMYTFSSLANLQAARYVQFQQAFGVADQRQFNPNTGLYLQEEWKPLRALTINLGLRHDLQFLPEPVQLDANNLSPRLGIAYSPDRKTVIRASAGVYYDRIPLRATSNALQRDGLKYRVAVISFGQPGAPAFPDAMREFPPGILTSISSIEPAIQPSYSVQTNLQVEREVARNSSVAAGFMRLRGMHILISRNMNVPRFSVAEAAARGIANLGRPDPNFGNISQYQGAGDSYYNALTVSFNRRAAGWAGVRLSYTFSKAIDNAGNFFFSSPQDNFNLRDDRGLSDNDQRHNFVLSGTLQPRRGKWIRGFLLSYMASYHSGYPFNILTGTDRNNDTNVNDRPAGAGRNTGKGFDYFSADVRLSRQVKMSERWNAEVMAEVFNTTNRANYQFPNNVFGPGLAPLAAFGRPTAASDARQIQLGLRLAF